MAPLQIFASESNQTEAIYKSILQFVKDIGRFS